MFRLITTAIVMLYIATASAQNTGPLQYVNLNAPGALEKLKATKPEHYDMFNQILLGLRQRPQGQVPRWIQTTFNATDVFYSDILLTTHPPLRDLGFNLQGTHYSARVTLTREGAKVFPARR